MDNVTYLKTSDLDLHHLKLHLLNCLRSGIDERAHGVHVHPHSLLLSESVGRSVDCGRHGLLHTVGSMPDVEVLGNHISQLVFLLLGVEGIVVGYRRVTGDLKRGTWCRGIGSVWYGSGS